MISVVDLINSPVRRLLVSIAAAGAEWRELEGISVGVVVPKNMDSEECYTRIHSALRLIVRTVPYRATKLAQDVHGILCFGTGKDEAWGAYVPSSRLCLVDPRHVLDSNTTVPELARTILHEATHARIHRRGIKQSGPVQPRVESVCQRAEADFIRKHQRHMK